MELTRYINMFDTATAYTAAVENEELNYPNLSYVEETGAIHLDATAPTPTHDYSQDYFTIVSLVDGNNIDFVDEAGVMDNPISASTDNGSTWTAYDVQLLGRATIATLDQGEKVLVKVIQTDNTYEQNYGKVGFDIIGQYTSEGNIMSLVYGDNFTAATTLPNDNMFKGFFSGDTNLISAENLVLPATTLTTSCYRSMFYGCTSLTTAPELPASTMATSCYRSMFNECTSLTTAPVLSATTLANDCYSYMFRGCTSLTTAPELPATTMAASAYTWMFNGCTSLTTAPELPATTLANDCYSNMFTDCSGMTAAPSELPATTLANNCYANMFNGCKSLTTAPDLPAETITNYSWMFSGCTSLNYIKCLATNPAVNSNTYYWVDGVASTGTFVKKSGVSWPSSQNGIPNGWTVQEV